MELTATSASNGDTPYAKIVTFALEVEALALNPVETLADMTFKV